MLHSLPYAANPVLPGKEHVPDAEPRIFGDRLYLYGSHDETGADCYCAGSYVGWSAPLTDLAAWRYEGVILEKGLDPLDPEGKGIYYAPDVIHGADGRYYLYYSIEGSMILSVAVCDTPAGSYRFYGHVQTADGHVLGSAPGDDYQFDPALLEDEGRYYLYSGQGMPVPEINGRIVKGAQVCELEQDMLTLKTPQRVLTSASENPFLENPFFEASSIRKIHGKYYFVYSPLPNTHNLCYAVSDWPDRDFRYAGVLVSNADIFAGDEKRLLPRNYYGNNHGGLLVSGDDIWIFYHRNTNRSPFARQACAERLQMDEKKYFRQAELTSQGLRKAPFSSRGSYAAYIAWALCRKDVKPFIPYTFLAYDDLDPYISEENDTELPFIANLTEGASAGFRYFDFDGKEAELTLRLRSIGTGRVIVKQNDAVLAEVPVAPAEAWTEVSAPCQAQKGAFSLTMTYLGEGKMDLLQFSIR